MFLHFIQKKEHKEAFLELAFLAANVDGFVNQKEIGFLHAFMDELNIHRSDQDFSSVREISDIIGDLQDEQIKHIFFAEILLLIYADGVYNDNEKQVIMDMKRLFDITDETYEAFKNWVIRLDQIKIEGMKLILNSSNAK